MRREDGCGAGAPRSFLLGEDFAFAEEAFDFGGSCFGRVGSVADVAHLGVAGLVAEVATDGSGGGFGGVGWTEEVAHFADDVFASEGEGDDGSLLHEATHVWEEGHVCDVGVVLGEDFVREGHHLDAFNLKASCFVASEDGSDVAFRDCVGLEENECGFLGHVEGGLARIRGDSKARELTLLLSEECIGWPVAGAFDG